MPHVRSDAVVASALAASDRGLADAENARIHGVAIKTIRRWRRLYQRRGLPRGQAHSHVPCPRCEEADLDQRAYAELLGWYLGDGHISLAPRGVYGLHIVNDQKYVELNRHIIELMKLVKPGGQPHTRLRPGAVITTVSWKHWPCLFPQHGPGRKHDRLIELDQWQKDIVSAHPADFVRGLFHSDGARSANWTRKLVAGEMKRYDYPRWQFSNNSDDIRALCCWALDLLDIPWKQSSWKTISVSRRPAVARLDRLIGLKA
ncbi:transcriptional regulator [Nocardioides cavernaquae]|uniref:Transcriptional regulator n=1 Tax=Nocardioides cavernaquae TaxID=2321396 RepID=A0A3A5HG16_9ACTN|nr:transcriptional regulator [Nocardioides cavernaquae]RJS47004.1 transcriptional regulator [Nocardioides cavernaquae]